MKLVKRIQARLGVFRSAGTRYHLWYYRNRVWDTTTWIGVKTLKSPSDMWNYQEILYSLKPSLVIEFGTRYGGSALFFAAVMRQIGRRFRLLSVDIDGETVSEQTRRDPDIELLTVSSLDPRVGERIADLRREYPGPVFVILDSDHSKAHVLGELKTLRPLLVSGDYLIVEDSSVNGHPVYPTHGPGPFEAVHEYFQQWPKDYNYDGDRESKFGFSFATRGFLIRR
ncbi:MAG TPA: CmcI family methyltransferase [Terriglobales bacterium]|jgi:cephalosporin hydroxylase|nr:CmcI family methyltransferase [Terriglobales bacterium]